MYDAEDFLNYILWNMLVAYHKYVNTILARGIYKPAYIIFVDRLTTILNTCNYI